MDAAAGGSHLSLRVSKAISSLARYPHRRLAGLKVAEDESLDVNQERLHWVRPQGLSRQQLLQCITPSAVRVADASCSAAMKMAGLGLCRVVAEASKAATDFALPVFLVRPRCDSPLLDAQTDAVPDCESLRLVKTEVDDNTFPVSDALVSDCNVKTEGSVTLSEPAVARDVSGTMKTDPDEDPDSTKIRDVSGDLKIESDGDPDWQDLDSHLGSDDESAHDSIAPPVVDTADVPLVDNPGEGSTLGACGHL